MQIIKSFSTGVYKITNVVNNKCYIGSASKHKEINGYNKGFYIRSSKHISDLIHNKHSNKHLQASFNKYGDEAFKIEILEKCKPEMCIKLEQWYINLYKPEYNICKIAGSCLGRVLTQEHKDNISKANMNRKMSKQWIDKIANSNKGNIKRNLILSKSKIGKSKSEEGKIANRDKRRLHKSITRLTIDDVINIKKALLNNTKQKDLSKIYNVGYCTIQDIKHNRTFKDITINV